MKLNGQLIRSRRRELGLSKREMAKLCGAGMSFIASVESKGGGEFAQLHVIYKLASALDLTIDDLIAEDRPPENPDIALVRRIGAHLLRTGHRETRAALARKANADLLSVENATKQLAKNLLNTGLTINENDDGIQLLPVANTSLGDDSAAEAINRLSTLNAADLKLLHRITQTRIRERQVSNKKLNGLSSVAKLESAGLVRVDPDGHIALAPIALRTLHGDFAAK